MEKLDAGHSKGLRDKVTSFFTGHDVEMLESVRDHTRKKRRLKQIQRVQQKRENTQLTSKRSGELIF